jgi:hypothetical protein
VREVETPDEDVEEAVQTEIEALLAAPLADPAIRVADEILTRHGSTDASKMLTDSRVLLAVRGREADAEVIKHLAEKGIDWNSAGPESAGEAVPDLESMLEVELRPLAEPLMPGSEAIVELKLRNTGKSSLHRIEAILDSDVGFLVGYGALVGRIAPSAIVTRELKIKLPADLDLARVPLDVVVADESGAHGRFGPFHLFVADGKRPHLAHRVEVQPSDVPDEIVLRVEVANRGDKDAGEIRVRAEQPDPEVAELIQGTATFPSLAPGERVSAELKLKRLGSMETLPALKLDIIELDHRVFVTSKIDLASGTKGWMDPPRVHFTHALVPSDGGGVHEVVAEITDDEGIARTWAALDGDKIAYADTSALRPTKHSVTLPWDPRAEAKRYEVVVRDVDGLVTRLVTQL